MPYIFPYAMIAAMILLLVEMRLAAKWSSFYFKRGIKLYGCEAITTDFAIDLDALTEKLNDKYSGSVLAQSIKFRKIDEETIAFREALMSFSLFNYTPFLHGRIEIRMSGIKLTALANWFPMAFFFLWYVNLGPNISLLEDFIFIIAPIVIFAIVYVIQTFRYRRIMNLLTDSEA